MSSWSDHADDSARLGCVEDCGALMVRSLGALASAPPWVVVGYGAQPRYPLSCYVGGLLPLPRSERRGDIEPSLGHGQRNQSTGGL